MSDFRIICLALLFAGQAALARWAGGVEIVPKTPNLEAFPPRTGAWLQLSQDAIPSAMKAQLNAGAILSRTYRNERTGDTAGLFVAWFGSQRYGDRQPHSPEVCLPGSGWTPERSVEVTIATDAGPIAVNRMVVTRATRRAVILYWYESSHRVLASQWAEKLWLVADAVRYRRTDEALVRIYVPLQGNEGEALRLASDFARTSYPILRAQWPQ